MPPQNIIQPESIVEPTLPVQNQQPQQSFNQSIEPVQNSFTPQESVQSNVQNQMNLSYNQSKIPSTFMRQNSFAPKLLSKPLQNQSTIANVVDTTQNNKSQEDQGSFFSSFLVQIRKMLRKVL